jgi:proline iminopeptidase
MHLIRRAVSLLLFVLGLAVALAASLFAAYEIAKATSRVGVLVATALAVFFLLLWLVAAGAARLWGAGWRRFALRCSAVVTVLFAVALWFAVLRPSQYPHLVPVARANTQYWSLPSGSRIAYSVYEPPAGVLVKPEPIVFLHGGPGVRATDLDHAFYSQFAKDGFRVYLFDQAGSGLSDRLPHAGDYTVERYVTDLEEIRQQIGAERMILIGHSWGGMLAAHYVAAYPARVAKLVFHSPGPVWFGSFVPYENQRTDAVVPRPLPPARMIAALELALENPAAGENLVSQQESGDWELATGGTGELACKGHPEMVPESFRGQMIAGMNMYPLLVTNHELKETRMDVRPQLRSLKVPAIALEAECDFIPWSEHAQYRRTIPGLQEFYFPGAAHYINFAQPEKLAGVIRAFLLDEPPPFPAYEADIDPRPKMQAKR